jgi:GTP-binding protein
MPLVAIVGRPNVGKSTFFNRVTETRHSIVDDMSGVTRDRVYGHAEWQGRGFAVVDTGGFVPNTADRFEAAIREQVAIALDEADVIVLVVDVTTGVTDLDQEVGQMLRRTEKPVFVLANKADNDERRWQAAEFWQLNVGEVFPVSSINGMGAGDLLDAVVKALPVAPPAEADERTRIAIIGRPNVGKSSLTNAWLGEERSIVTEISGTTRDSVDATLRYHGRELVLVDTAGLRKRSRIQQNVEFYALLRTERAIESCDVAVLLIDAESGLEAQDIKVLKMAEQQHKGLVIGINKWDLIEKETNTARDFERSIKERLRTLEYVPVVTISATSKQRVSKLLETVLAVEENRRRRVTTSDLNDLVLPALEAHRPPSYRGQAVRVKYATQTRTEPPVFVFFCNHPDGIKEPYRRYLENRLREAFDFTGVPLVLSFRKK